MGRILALLLGLHHACRQLRSCIQTSPIVACVITAVVLVLASLILLFNLCLARLFPIPGAGVLILNALLFWLILRLAVRAVTFPGSIVLFKRNTEAMYRVGLAKHWVLQFKQLLAFLQTFHRAATGRAQSAGPGASLEGAWTGCALVEALARNLRAQQRDQVRLTQEQARMRLLLNGVEAWLAEAKVCDRHGGKADVQVPLVDWLRRMANSLVPVPLAHTVANASLVRESEAELGTCIEHLEQLLVLVDGLHRQEGGRCARARRFLRVPTVGSLHQMRAELLMRYNGTHCWVRTADGRKIDGMFVACRDSENGSLGSEDASKEEVAAEAGAAARSPVVIWCNPNAGYYETMAYDTHWLDFYLSHGCSVFLFNYGGYGRSQGNTSTFTVAADGKAVVDFLKRRGFTQIGVHGRSIGGIPACSIAQAHPDVVKFLVADRTFASLGRVAKYSFGDWAAKALGLSATWADNLQPFLQARCHKVMICDPQDATVPDLSSLRTGVAVEALLQVPQADRLAPGEDRIRRLAEAWAFFDTLVAVCDREGQDFVAACEHSAKRPARQPVVGKPQVEPEGRLEAGEEDTQRLVTTWPRGEARKSNVDVRWLEEHVEIVQAVMSSHVDAIRLALDVVGTQLNAGGATLDDALSRGGLEDACEGLRCFVANIQVWGSLSSSREAVGPAPGADVEVELFLSRRPDHLESQKYIDRLNKVTAALSPDRISAHHRQLSRTLVAQVRWLFRQQLSALRRALEPNARDDGSPASALCAAVLAQLREIEGFMTVLDRFLKCVDIAGNTAGAPASPADLISGVSVDTVASDDSEECRDPVGARPLRPTIDRSVTGYLICIDCGHNGALSEAELQHLVRRAICVCTRFCLRVWQWHAWHHS